MCSIAGAYYFDKSRYNETQICEKINKCLSFLMRRGPDESACMVVSQNCVMGGNRLIINGSKNDGSMPYRYGYNAMFYNGEIYNYKKWDLEAIPDGKVILPLYSEFGKKTFSKLDGEFALSIWDAENEQLLLVRDHFGTKPLYFSLNKHRLIWASSASAISEIEEHEFCAAVKGPTYIHSYAVQEPYTSYKGIWLIPPGHCLIVNRSGARLYCYNAWDEESAESTDTTETFDFLEQSLISRMNYNDTIGIPMSSGIDSGIIAFMADRLGIKYQIFSLVEIFGQATEESDNILRRIERLKNAHNVTLLRCNESEYQQALQEIFLPTYYDSEKFDNGNILMHTVFNAISKAGIKVVIDGSGGDELFHGYRFREDFKPIEDWPESWKKNNYFYSIYTTLLDYTSKSDRAGAYFSMESRYPFQNHQLMLAASKLKPTSVLKWPLRNFLLERVKYGNPNAVDINGKYGFSIKNRDKIMMIEDMRQSWLRSNNLLSMPLTPPDKFPFLIGSKT